MIELLGALLGGPDKVKLMRLFLANRTIFLPNMKLRCAVR